MFDPTTLLQRVLCILRDVFDVIEGRVDEDETPRWCQRRGWDSFLLSLSDAEVAQCESDGLAFHIARRNGAPPDLVSLAGHVTSAMQIASLPASPFVWPANARRRVAARKQGQLAALMGALGPMAAATQRIVDVGSGRGAFSRLAAEVFARPTVGIERDAQRVATAQAFHQPRAATSFPSSEPAEAPEFWHHDGCRGGLPLLAGDLAVGLHACGELGDQLVATVANVGCQLALVSCCLQKITDSHRPPLSRAGAQLRLPRSILGLTNLATRSQGVETDTATSLRARQSRYALRLLLRDRGVNLAPGSEMHGINRRRAYQGWPALAQHACAVRDMPPPTPTELQHHEARARQGFARIRRWSLPRSMLARLVEIAVVLDRACRLQEQGLQVQVAALCNDVLTPRNLAIFAGPHGSCLPARATKR